MGYVGLNLRKMIESGNGGSKAEKETIALFLFCYGIYSGEGGISKIKRRKRK